jgi:hypothetical protein
VKSGPPESPWQESIPPKNIDRMTQVKSLKYLRPISENINQITVRNVTSTEHRRQNCWPLGGATISSITISVGHDWNVYTTEQVRNAAAGLCRTANENKPKHISISKFIE